MANHTFYLLTILIFLLIWCSLCHSLSAQNPFITTWQTNNEGVSCSSCITIPTFAGENYSYDIDWEDDGIYDDFGVTGDMTHDYGTPGLYRVAIRGVFPRIYFDGIIIESDLPGEQPVSDSQKLIEIPQWGDVVWSSMSAAFKGCHNLLSVDEASPDLSKASDLSYMFFGAGSFNSDLNGWDVSNVINMNDMFRSAHSFDANINNWDVGNVINMSGMFASASKFNQDIGAWLVSNVTNMNGMFSNASNFNQNLSNWDVSSVLDMGSMFLDAKAFNQDISNWNVGNVKNMSAMFFRSFSFNQDIGDWNVINVRTMVVMFNNAFSFNQNLGNWNLFNAEELGGMLDFSGLSQSNYEATLFGWAQNDETPVDLELGAFNLEYCDETGRDALLGKGWTFDGDIQISEGDTCDDGDEETQNDRIDSKCECIGDPLNSTRNIDASTALIVSPNPADEWVNIKLLDARFNDGVIYFFDTNGRLLQEANLQHNNYINTTNLPVGMIFYQIHDPSSELMGTGKLVLQREE